MKVNTGDVISHPSYGEGAVFGTSEKAARIFFKEHGEKEMAREFDGFELLEKGTPATGGIELEDVIDAVQNVFDNYYEVNEIVELGDKWKGGTMVLKPEDDGLKPKDIPIETFFHKIVMLRDRLRVLEQNINSHKVLTDEEKVHMQQYITRAYGSLTSFNILFENKAQHFSGTKKD